MPLTWRELVEDETVKAFVVALGERVRTPDGKLAFKLRVPLHQFNPDEVTVRVFPVVNAMDIIFYATTTNEYELQEPKALTEGVIEGEYVGTTEG